jgi:hypothetical protein
LSSSGGAFTPISFVVAHRIIRRCKEEMKLKIDKAEKEVEHESIWRQFFADQYTKSQPSNHTHLNHL